MALQIRDETIDGVKVITQQLPAMRAMTLAARLARLLGPLASGIRHVDMKNVSSLMEGDLATIAPVVGEWLGRLEEESFMLLVRELLRDTQATGSDGRLVQLSNDTAINDVFNGRLGTLLKVLVWSVRLNFGSFFDALPAVVPGASGTGETRQSPSISPS